jgi:uncharacterized protein YdhG (YjbR/CyaY superfamily)
MKKPENIDEFISEFDAETQEKLRQLRRTITESAPDAIETINYGIPTFKLNGKNLVHFSAYKTHIGFYPGAQAIEHFKTDFASYKTSKGTVQFPLDKPVPLDLVKKVTLYLASAMD